MKMAQRMMSEIHVALQGKPQITDDVVASFAKIAPFWPLKNLIAVNPLQGWEETPIEEALQQAAAHFQQAELPPAMEAINRETIKWMQVFVDDGQATLGMPLRTQGLYAAWRAMAPHDARLHRGRSAHQSWLRQLPATAEQAIAESLLRLSIPREERALFMTRMLTTLPGWAAYVKYRTEWAGLDADHPHPVTQMDYLAMRLVITCLLWPEAKALLDWDAKTVQPAIAGYEGLADRWLARMQQSEAAYRKPLLKQLSQQTLGEAHTPKAQLVFCIDVRSEPFRRTLEATGDYQTYGFAGFFGVPVQIEDRISGESHASCPVLLAPKHRVSEAPCTAHGCTHAQQGYRRTTMLKSVYQSVKYSFSTPFALVEGLGMLSGAWMFLRSLAPVMAATLAGRLSRVVQPPHAMHPSLETIPLSKQITYAEGALRTMGLTSHFAPLVVLCGHGSTTHNNAYATALDCGACGGRHGAPNARILAAMLNQPLVRQALAARQIQIPEATRFLAAQHNTTTDDVVVFGADASEAVQALQRDLATAREINSHGRLAQMQLPNGQARHAWQRAHDWAQVRPEWGLARNAAFIVAPRGLTASMNLEGRCFLHSYDYQQDPDGQSLTVILTAPMVVAEWINTQYLFSTLDNVAYGSGSKVTHNVTGKMGVMQGNASDLMTGLPLQSVFSADDQPYHEPQRLMCVVYAPPAMVLRIVHEQPVLQKLFGNGWVQLSCMDPTTRAVLWLGRDLSWQTQH